MPVLTPSDQEALVAKVPGPLGDAVAVALDTGLRTGELLRLTFGDVDLARGRLEVHVSKNRRPRSVALTGRGRAALERARARAGDPAKDRAVFPEVASRRSSGEPCLSSTAQKRWRRVRGEAGFPGLRFHDLRHVFAVTALRAGVPLGDLRELLGHSSLPMVLRYARHVPRDAVEEARRRIEAYLETPARALPRGDARAILGDVQ